MMIVPENWTDNWFLDGKYATVENSEDGMSFFSRDRRLVMMLIMLYCGQKDSFKGDIKIEYDYIRTDSAG